MAFFLKLFQSDDSGEADCDESPLGRGGVLSASQECIRPRPYSALPNGRPQNHLSTNSVPLLTPQTKPTLSQIDPPTQQPRKEPRNKLKEVNVQNLGMMVISMSLLYELQYLLPPLVRLAQIPKNARKKFNFVQKHAFSKNFLSVTEIQSVNCLVFYIII